MGEGVKPLTKDVMDHAENSPLAFWIFIKIK